jgi:hypothetical protein
MNRKVTVQTPYYFYLVIYQAEVMPPRLVKKHTDSATGKLACSNSLSYQTNEREHQTLRLTIWFENG